MAYQPGLDAFMENVPSDIQSNFPEALRGIFMLKGYPIGLPMQRNRRHKVQPLTVIFDALIVAEYLACTHFIHPLLTMNSVARHVFPH